MGECLIKDNCGFDSGLVPHSIKAFAPLVELVSFVDNTCNFDLSGIEIVNCSS
jgi:hypothetical protein